MEQDGSKRRALGRGIEAFLPRSKPDGPPRISEAGLPAPATADGKPLEIAVALIDRNPFQTRTHFDEKQLQELTESIAASGVVQPVVVRRTSAERFQLITGERRWLASQRAQKLTIPAIVRQISDQQALEMTIVENLQRADLNPIEQARAFDRLSREFRMTQEQMATRTGKDRASVGNFMRLLRLPKPVQQKVEAGVLSFGHAKVLLALEHSEAILGAAQRIEALSMSVRQAETFVQGLLNPEKAAKKKLKEPLDPNVREARDELQRALGLRVTIEDKQGRGRVIIEYSRLEDFDSILNALVHD